MQLLSHKLSSNMKLKLFLTTALALIMGAGAFAQDIDFGVEAGVAGNWMPGTVMETGDQQVTHLGYYAGLTASMDITDMIFAQAELSYVLKGVSTRNEALGRYARNLSYIQLPLMIGFRTSEPKLNLYIGPAFGLCIGNRVVSDLSNITSTGTPRKFNVSGTAQMTYMFLGNLGIDVRFDFGLTKTMQDTTIGKISVDDNGRNMGIMMGLCYKFGE